jgi:hypothetical protein
MMKQSEMADALAEHIATRFLAMYGGMLISTGLHPDEILGIVMIAFVKHLPGSTDAPQEVLDNFTDSLCLALYDRYLLEHDLELVKRRGMRPS